MENLGSFPHRIRLAVAAESDDNNNNNNNKQIPGFHTTR